MNASSKTDGRMMMPTMRAVPMTASTAFLTVANSLLHGIEVLAAASPRGDHAMMLCAAHALECALKADLAAALTVPAAPSALSEKKLRSLGHDIMALWAEAGGRDLALQLPAPAWVEALAALHESSDHTFPLRYQEGLTRGTYVHGMQYPVVQDVATELPKLVSLVRQSLADKAEKRK